MAHSVELSVSGLCCAECDGSIRNIYLVMYPKIKNYAIFAKLRYRMLALKGCKKLYLEVLYTSTYKGYLSWEFCVPNRRDTGCYFSSKSFELLLK